MLAVVEVCGDLGARTRYEILIFRRSRYAPVEFFIWESIEKSLLVKVQLCDKINFVYYDALTVGNVDRI